MKTLVRAIACLFPSAFVFSSAWAAPKVLVVLSAANELTLANGARHPTGFFLGELVEPLEELTRAGFEFEIAMPGGLAPRVDRDSERWFYWAFNRGGLRRAQAFVRVDPRLARPRALDALSDQDLDEYAGLFVPGGHAPMVDLAHGQSMARVLLRFHAAAKPIGLICHAPSVLLSLRSNEPWPFQGYEMTVFSDLEERIAERLFLGGPVPFYPQTELERLGARVRVAGWPSVSHVVRDRELVTGQNPQSARAFGSEFARLLRDSAAR